ncbi:hypothetical protein [Anaerobutyricum soehngenii]|nr:hypothetical protein [Anaerobutyricum soehngenii]
MLIRILNTLRSRIWEWYCFFFLSTLNPQLVRRGIAQKAMDYRGIKV